MCTILKFAPATKPEQPQRGCGKPRMSGEIVLFPGVRYERTWDDGHLSAQPEAQSKRDFLVL